MNSYGWILFTHIASASAFVMTMLIMQLVVANVMKKIPDSAGKKEGVRFIQTRWHPVVDGIIVAVGITAVLLAIDDWSMIRGSIILHAKVAIGFIALTSAYANHFCFRYWKRNLAASGKNPDLLKRLGKITAVLDKTALIGGIITALLGWYYGHV